MIVSRHKFNGEWRENKIYRYDVVTGNPLEFVKKIIECYEITDWHVDVMDDSCDDIGALRGEIAHNLEELDKYDEKVNPTYYVIEGKIDGEEIRYVARITETGIRLQGGEDLYEGFQSLADDENCDWITDPDK